MKKAMHARLNYSTQQIFMVFIIFCLVIHGIYLWLVRKCVCVHKCYKKTCKFRNLCPKYEAGLTQEDKEELYRLLDEFKMEDK